MPPFAQPPVKDTKIPRIAVPKNAVDTHFHLFGPSDRYSFVDGSIYISGDALAEHVKQMHAKLGIGRGVYISGGGYGRNFRHLADVLRADPDYFRGIIVPPPHMHTVEIEELDRLGVRGVRYVSAKRGGGRHLAPIMPELSARVHELGWHVQFYPHGEDILDYAEQLLALPNDIVLDHFGSVPAELGVAQPAFRKVLDMLETGRVWVKISGPMRCTSAEYPYADVTPLARELVRLFPERLVWGTDWPHVNYNEHVMPNDGDLLDLLGEWVPDEAVRNRILVDNANRLYGFSD